MSNIRRMLKTPVGSLAVEMLAWPSGSASGNSACLSAADRCRAHAKRRNEMATEGPPFASCRELGGPDAPLTLTTLQFRASSHA
jgi:hypothetical protein